MENTILRTYDLNIKSILEDWKPEDAIREIIANALDETILSHTNQDIDIYKDSSGHWHIRDFGRGLHPDNFIQDESLEKKKLKGIIGKYGVGLKDAIATLFRNNIEFVIRTNNAEYHAEFRQKAGGSNEETLHIVETSTSDQSIDKGTDFIVTCDDGIIEKAKNMFCKYNNPTILATTQYGEILAPSQGKQKIYYNGLMIAEEADYLYSYNITKADKKLYNSLNRERKNVGKTAYGERIQDIICNLHNDSVYKNLFKKYESGESSNNELSYSEVLVTVIKWFFSQKDSKHYLIVSASESKNRTSEISDTRETYRKIPVQVPDKIYKKLEDWNKTNANKPGEVKVCTLAQHQRDRNAEFQPKIVQPEHLTGDELRVYKSLNKIWEFVHLPSKVEHIKIAEQLYSREEGMQTLGLWDPSNKTIFIKRSELRDLPSFLGVLLHEITHASSGFPDCTRGFENSLTDMIGVLSAKLIEL